MSEYREITLRAAQRPDGDWHLVVEHDGEEQAAVFAPDLDVAVRMAAPYLRDYIAPDPFADLLRSKS